jgi:hypothetical protein
MSHPWSPYRLLDSSLHMRTTAIRPDLVHFFCHYLGSSTMCATLPKAYPLQISTSILTPVTDSLSLPQPQPAIHISGSDLTGARCTFAEWPENSGSFAEAKILNLQPLQAAEMAYMVNKISGT